MRKSFWMIPAVLLFTVLGSTTAHADTIVTSGDGSVIGIDGIDIDHTTYNVTWDRRSTPRSPHQPSTQWRCLTQSSRI